MLRVSLTLCTEKPLTLPIHYNHIIQGFIYNNLPATLAREVHDHGFKFRSRPFKLFTFSRLLGNFHRNSNQLTFTSRIKLVVSSAIEEFILGLADTLIKKQYVYLKDQPLLVESLEVEKSPDLSNHMVVRMLSPVTVYSTLTRKDGSKKTTRLQQMLPHFLLSPRVSLKHLRKK